MKKTVAISLLLLFLFNLFGYRVWFYYMEEQSNRQLIASLDKTEYNEQDLITIKVPLSLPYFNNWSEFERYDGTIEINGQHYNYVKRKVYNDTLTLLCIPNQEQNKLSAAKNNYENYLADGKYPGSNKTTNSFTLLKSLLTDYNNNGIFYFYHILFARLLCYITSNENATFAGAVSSPWQPPDITAGPLLIAT